MRDLPAPRETAAWWLYVLRCRDATLYCGITNDLPKRLARHEAGEGARYTRGRGPLVVVRAWQVMEGKSAALKAERRFKRLRRTRKLEVLADEAGAWLRETLTA